MENEPEVVTFNNIIQRKDVNPQITHAATRKQSVLSYQVILNLVVFMLFFDYLM